MDLNPDDVARPFHRTVDFHMQALEERPSLL